MRRTGSQATDQVARKLELATNVIEGVPFLDGVEVEVTLVSGSSVEIKHGLGRKWVGALQMAQFNDGGADGRWWVERTHKDATVITVHADGYTTNPQLALWVF